MRDEAASTLQFLPEKLSYNSLRRAAAGCEACDLFLTATQTVFGEGPQDARVLMIGEQPGDEEDKQGRPFVGPAGRLLDRALEDAGIDRGEVYLTNAVKHFKWKQQGKRRLHQKPNAREIAACEPWLEAEISVVKPEIIVCLGATAAQDLIGKDFRITKMRGQWLASDHSARLIATLHPSAILRMPSATRDEEYSRFVDDLRIVTAALEETI